MGESNSTLKKLFNVQCLIETIIDACNKYIEEQHRQKLEKVLSFARRKSAFDACQF